jgi:hypothetical protein
MLPPLTNASDSKLPEMITPALLVGVFVSAVLFVSVSREDALPVMVICS